MTTGAWSVVDLGCDDETRQAIIGPSSITSLYEIVKLAYLQPNDENDVIPSNIVSCASWGLVCIGLGKSLLLFNENCSTLKLQLTFEDTIDTMLCVGTSEFLLVGDRGGNLHFIQVSTRKILMTRRMPVPPRDDGPLFVSSSCHPIVEGSTTVVLLTWDGYLIRLGNLNIERLQEGLRSGCAEELIEVQSQLTLELLSLVKGPQVCCSGSVLGVRESDVWVWFATTDGQLLQYSSYLQTHVEEYSINSGLEEDYIELVSSAPPGTSYKRIIPVCNGSMLITLTSMGELTIVSPMTHHTVPCASFVSLPVMDALLLPWTDNGQRGSTEPLQLLLLLDNTANKQDSWLLRIVAIPGFHCEYEVEVSCNSEVLPLGEGSEAMVFLEPDPPLNTQQSGIKIKTIVDGQPDMRLQKLISKLKFDEAEKFAVHFGLDVELVMKGRARHVSHLLNPFRTTTNVTASVIDTPGANMLQELIDVLEKINDAEFVTSVCIDTTLPDVSSTSALLNYAKKRLSTNTQNLDSERLFTLSQRVSEELYRLKTLTILYPSEDITVDQWLMFSSADMLWLYKQHLSKGQLSMASTIWQRHQHEFQCSVDPKTVESILQLVPCTLSSSSLIEWLPHNLADLMHLCPQAIDSIVRWALNRINRLESLEKVSWPGNGLRLSTLVLSVLESVVAQFSEGGNIELQMSVQLAQWKAHLSPNSALYQLRQTVIALQELNQLAMDYKIKLSLKDYMQDDVGSVLVSLLDWLVSGTEVRPLLDGFIIPVLLKQSPASLDQLLAQYVDYTLAGDTVEWWGWQEAHWEDKLYAVIDNIRDEQIKVSCIVSCVRVASVPWSVGTQELCQQGLGLVEHLGGEEKDMLEEQKRLVTLKIILRRHSIHIHNFTDIRVPQIVLRRLARSPQDGVIQDMLKVVSIYSHLEASEAYMFRAYHLLSTGDESAAQTLLQSVPASDLPSTLSRLLHTALQLLSVNPASNKVRVTRLNVLSGVISMENLFMANAKCLPNISADLNMIRTLSTLHAKFNIILSSKALSRPEVCEDVLNERLKDWYEEHHGSLQTVDTSKSESRLELKQPVERTSAAAPLPLQDLTNTVAGDQGVGRGEPRSRADGKENEESASEEADGTPQEKNNDSERTVARLEPLYEMSRLLSKDRVFVLQKLAQLSIDKSHTEVALLLVRMLSREQQESEGGAADIPHLVCGVLKLILKQLQVVQETCKCSTDDDTFATEDTEASTKNAATIRELLHLTYEMVSGAVGCAGGSAENHSVLWLLLVAGWCKIGVKLYELCHEEHVFSFTAATINEHKRLLQSHYTDSGMPIDSEKVSEAMKEVLSLCISRCSDPSASPSEKLYSALLDLSIHATLRNCDLTAVLLSIKASTLSLLPDSILTARGLTIESNKLFTLLFKIVSPHKTDVKLAVSLLTFITLKKALSLLNELIKKFGYDYPRLESLAEVGGNLCSLHKQTDIMLQFDELAKNSAWGTRFGELNISFKDSFLKHASSLHKLFDTIVVHPKCSHSLLSDFCSDFNLSLTDALLCFLKSSLHSFVPEPVKNLAIEDKWVIPKMPDSLYIQLNTIIRKVPDRHLLFQTLLDELNKTMSYNFDIIHFILDNLLTLYSEEYSDVESWRRALDILQFLKVYERKAKPGSVEHEEWINKNPNSTTLPTIALQRLPFHELFERGPKLAMRIIESELDVQTIDLWLSTAECLNLNQDQMCFFAVQNTVSRTLGKRVTMSSVKWELSNTHSGLLRDIAGVILKITHDKLAVACAKNVVSKLPPGVDKVESSCSCLKLAERWLNRSESTEAKEAFEKFREQYHQLAVEHALHKYGVAEARYLKLVNDPISLITLLYDHPSLSSLSALATHKMPDINQCVSDICKITEYDQEKIQRDLLEKWLPPPESGGGDEADDDVTVSNFQINLLASEHNSEASVPVSVQASLSRVIYLLRGCDPDLSISYLLNCIESSNTTVNTEHKLRALKCLLAVAPPHTLTKYVTVDNVKALLKKLSYVCRLEALGCPTDLEQFSSVDKSALAEGVWRAHRHNPKALFLITDVCLEFGVTKPSLWNAVLNQLANFAGLEEQALRALLLGLRKHPHLWLLQGFTQAWSALVTAPFNRARKPLSDATLHDCIVAAGVLAQCPVSLPSVEGILVTCSALNLPALSLVIIGSCSGEHRKMQELFDASPKDELVKQFRTIKTLIPLPRLVEILLESNNISLNES